MAGTDDMMWERTKQVNTNLVIKLNGGSTEGTNMFTYNGSGAKTINITPSSIGAAASSAVKTYSAGTGLSLSGTTFNHRNSITAGNGGPTANKTLTPGGNVVVPYFTYDAQGHITGRTNRTITLSDTIATSSDVLAAKNEALTNSGKNLIATSSHNTKTTVYANTSVASHIYNVSPPSGYEFLAFGSLDYQENVARIGFCKWSYGSNTIYITIQNSSGTQQVVTVVVTLLWIRSGFLMRFV